MPHERRSPSKPVTCRLDWWKRSTLVSLHDFGAALTAVDALLEDAPSEPAALAVRFDAELELGRIDAARADLTTLEDRRRFGGRDPAGASRLRHRRRRDGPRARHRRSIRSRRGRGRGHRVLPLRRRRICATRRRWRDGQIGIHRGARRPRRRSRGAHRARPDRCVRRADRRRDRRSAARDSHRAPA